MLMVCHHLSSKIPEDISFAESRIRAETVAAEDVLHDIGALSMISSDSQAMGRIAEVVARTWRTASKMRQCRGPLTNLGDTPTKDNARVKRYISKYTINPAITHGISHVVGDVSVGKMADLVGWEFGRFGSSSGPAWVLKGGVVVWAQMGDANASVPSVEPCWGREMWGAMPGLSVGRPGGQGVGGFCEGINLRGHHSAFFISRASLSPSGHSPFESYGLSKPGIPVHSCRNIKKGDMKWNGEVPRVEVDPESYDVTVDGVRCDVEPAEEVCLGKAYNLF
jgi:urease